MTIIARFHNRKLAQTPKYKKGDVVYLNGDLNVRSAGTPLKIINSTGWVRNPKDVSYEVEYPDRSYSHVLEEFLTDVAPKFNIGDKVELLNTSGNVVGKGTFTVERNSGYDEQKKMWFYTVANKSIFGPTTRSGWPEVSLRLVGQQQKFKVGDRIKVIKDDSDPNTIGREGEVLGYDAANKVYRCKLDGYGNTSQTEDELEFAKQQKIKMHDHVVLKDASQRNYNVIGQVISIDYKRGEARIEFPDDKYIEWWKFDELEVVTDKVKQLQQQQQAQPQQAAPVQQQPVQQAPAQPSKPWGQRMKTVLDGLAISPTDKSLKQEYEDLLAEQHQTYLNDVVAKRKRRKK